MDEKDQKTYEISVLVKDEGDLAVVSGILSRAGASLHGAIQPKRIALAYPIKKQNEAIFAYCYFSAQPEAAKAIEKELPLQHEILRSLIIASPPGEKAQADRARRSKPSSHGHTPGTPSAPAASETPRSLSNEALEKKLEEILK